MKPRPDDRKECRFFIERACDTLNIAYQTPIFKMGENDQ